MSEPHEVFLEGVFKPFSNLHFLFGALKELKFTIQFMSHIMSDFISKLSGISIHIIILSPARYQTSKLTGNWPNITQATTILYSSIQLGTVSSVQYGTKYITQLRK